MKDASLMHGYENGKHGGYGNERKFFVERFFFCLRIMQNVFFPFVSLRDRRSEEETCVWMEVETCGDS